MYYAYYIFGGVIAATVLLILLAVLFINTWRSIRRRRRRARMATVGRPKRQRNTPNLLRVWAREAFEDDENATGTGVVRWVQGLDKRAMRRLIDEMLDFGWHYGFDPHWVLKNATEIDPELTLQLNGALRQWLKARYDAAQAAQMSLRFQIYQELISQGRRAENADLIQSLYAQLVATELAPPTPANLMLASEKERAQYAIKQIEEAAQKNWVLFSQMMQNALDDRNATGGRRNRRTSSNPANQVVSTPATANA